MNGATLPLLLTMSILLIIGFLSIAGSFAQRKKLLTDALQVSNGKVRELLYQPLQELLLGFAFTFAGFYFASRIFGGKQALLLAFAIAAGIVAMTSWGSCSRFRQAAEALSLPQAQKQRLFRLQKISSLGIFCVLLGLLAGLASLCGFGQ